MKITIIGGGPAGLYFAILMKRQNAAHDVTVIERDGPEDTFGWGIVFSDQTFSYLEACDGESFRKIIESCEIWDNVDVVSGSEKITIRGNKFSGIARLRFLNILQERAAELGVDLRFRTTVNDVSEAGPCDLLVGADGANSLVRRTYADYFQPTVELRRNRYIWLGTPHLFHGLTLTFRETEDGIFIAHSYKFNRTTSTFIVECTEATWRRAGLDRMSDEQTCEYLAKVFVNDLEGAPLLSNNYVRWLNFPLIKNRRWYHENIVLLGDALHTAHFSIGSGTKLALEDAIALARCFESESEIGAALALFEQERKPMVDRTQEAAQSSLLLFESLAEEIPYEPMELAYRMMTRSKRIDDEKLRRRDPDFVAAYERWRAARESNA